jgi:hypothetical protein
VPGPGDTLPPQTRQNGFKGRPRSSHAARPFQYTTLAFALAVTDFEKQLWNHHCVIKQRESSNARHLVAQAIIDCAHKGIREPDEKRRCAYEDPDRLNRREA